MSPLATNINLVLGFLFQLGSKVESVISGGSISFLQLPSFIGVFEAAGPALAAAKQIPSEISAISDADLVAIRAYVQSQLPTVVPNATVDGLIEDGLDLAQNIYDFVAQIRAAKNPAPAAPVAPVAPASPAS